MNLAAGQPAVPAGVKVVTIGVAAPPEEAVAHERSVVEVPAAVDGLTVASPGSSVADGRTMWDVVCVEITFHNKADRWR